MPYQLAPHLSGCIANDRVVLLDLNTSRYVGLKPILEATFLKLAVNTPLQAEDIDHLQTLLSLGYLIETSQRSSAFLPCADLARAQQSLARRAVGQVDWWKTTFAVALQVHHSLTIPTIPLATIIGRIEHRKTERQSSSSFATNKPNLVEAFHRSGRILGTHDRCLRRSIAMIDFLAHFHWYPTLVIGVKMNPFAAHAWVQDGMTVLNDELDHVLPFTPIVQV